MDKNTILAIVLSVVVITVGMTIQTSFFTPAPTADYQETVETITPSTAGTANLAPAENALISSNLAWNTKLPGSLVAVGDQGSTGKFVFKTDVFTIEFNPVGASVSSFKLNKHLDNGEPVELLFKGPQENDAFLLYAGNDKTNPIDATFRYKVIGKKVVFSQDFEILDSEGNVSGKPFTLSKTFTFGDADYLFQLDIALVNSENKSIPLSYENFAYTLGFEPQIGPSFSSLPNNNYNYRRFYIKEDGSAKKKQIKLSNGNYTTSKPLSWVALAGKYFSMIAIPDAASYQLSLNEDSTGSIAMQSNMYFSRPAIKSSSQNDTFRFYAGPQLKADMVIYNDADSNSFKVANLDLEQALDSSSWLGWLENFLKILLNWFYKIIPNYGVGIIILTFLLKLVLYPISKKGMDSTAKMSALGPKMEEIKAKYPDNPAKQNEETAALYKKEKINPMGGCLPMLVQFPILIAFYGLLNKHFELRGAMFIPGWIPDLSMPDTVFMFPFTIPFIGNELHLLPIIYTVSMIYSMKITQNASTAGSQQGMMKFMTYGMPLMFFFVLYSAPSGLILYWSVMNALSIFQQMYTNHKRKNEIEKAPEPSKVKQFPTNKGSKGKRR
ncbi:membrane protein insertase, YidC/Oxa1 family, N-terminal domain protein [Sphaerochaeta pleomorpha str. Grapes]|uniref:Membrane protein insertase YidC n=1 Tax=Sphaerochaeta pleomorpha (strain ATCC BAA-1885 / DSM 22778 / Grapes) TaxID=158190 RepID=G8QYT2_SPHPG|nr:membrane protein insertase YidC [Sphaerochaeta pleomorpha]AEV29709.1 membrane protein insertase, YidC/Oxa1 family, N-terminal domain protein [Sphaerochaeta pleomorpha str. Grapes]